MIVAKIIELDEVQHLYLYRRVEGVGWQSEMGDGVAVDPRLAGFGAGDGVGVES